MTILKKQGVAWAITAVMILAAIAIGLAKGAPSPAPAPDTAAPAPDSADGYVYDEAGVLSRATRNTLTQRNAGLLDRCGVAIAVVTTDYGGDDLGGYAMDYAESIGLTGYDMIVVLDIGGENYWLLQGADLAGDFTDRDCSDYAYEYMERAFAGRDYDSAVLRLTEALEDWYDDYFYAREGI